MPLVSHPGRAALLAGAGVGIVGGVDLLGSRCKRVVGTPVGDPLADALLLGPDLAQRLNCRHLRSPALVGGSVAGGQQTEPVRTKGLCACLALLLPGRQTVLFTARTLAVDPFRLTNGPYPVGRDHRQRIEGLPQRLPDAAAGGCGGGSRPVQGSSPCAGAPPPLATGAPRNGPAGYRAAAG